MKLEEAMKESWNIFGEIKSMFLPDGQGSLWSPINANPGLSNTLLIYYRSPWFNKIQRWVAEVLRKTNPVAISAVDNLTQMILGEGFVYTCESASEQKRLDEWMKKQNWCWRQREILEKLIVDGEVFIRLFNTKDYPNLRLVSPDLVYDNKSGLGINFSEGDYEEVISYHVNKEDVPESEMQHRKLGWSDEVRGTSLLFPIIQHCVNAEELVVNLNRTATALSKFAAIRTHDATSQQVDTYRSDIQSRQRNRDYTDCVNGVPGHNVEDYPAGSIVDASKYTTWEFPGAAIDGEKYVSILRATLRVIAARVGLPENVLSQDQDSIAAYSGQMVANSHVVKGIENWQRRINDWDMELFEKAGFNTDKISITNPEVAMPDPTAQVAIGQFLLSSQIASKQTIGKMFEVNFEDEQIIMEKEPKTEVDNTGDKKDANK